MESHAKRVEEQFGSAARNYLKSSVHSGGPDLEIFRNLLSRHQPARLLDIGCGGGHLSYAAAASAQSVVACDASPQMLSVVQQEAAARGLYNISTQRARAEALPFDAQSFDWVCTRYSAHHWASIPQAMQEIRRVLKPNGTAVIMDIYAPASPLLDMHLQAIELLRDGSHVRDYTLAEWNAFVEQNGCPVREVHTMKLAIDFDSWVQRMKTPSLFVDALRAFLTQAPAEVRDYFQVSENNSFVIDSMLMVCGGQS